VHLLRVWVIPPTTVANERKNKIREEAPVEEAPKRERRARKSAPPTEGKFARFKAFLADERTHKVGGLFLVLTSAFLLVAFTSYFFTWRIDQDITSRSWGGIFDRSVHVENWLGKLGALTSHQFIHQWFGVAAFVFVLWSFLEEELVEEEEEVVEEELESASTVLSVTGMEVEGLQPIETPLIDPIMPAVPISVDGMSVERGPDRSKLQEFGEYDPTLDLSSYELPPIDLLVDHGTGELTVTKEELEANKDRIVETLGHYNIGIDKIKATIGPTVTLYEIIPQAGVRISKIKNLEDDIALSLAALGIRIIAPIPGKGTIGIEVPNSKPQVVGMRAVIASEKFQNSTADLPIVLGKTISNETFVTDLAKMPHLLMAGATGQGKSVGLNAILVSLLYKKHPSQIKFVLVDPKKVELTLFNKIERHFLAKLPGDSDAIITDTKKVVATLNSLCIEMDERYELLKDAQVRNIKEYNAKFISRRLNPENGHRYLPYIVLVVDEFADLIMTAGREVETPIARLAQLARAIGIHLIIATQRPSVNIITGTIKANFPARIAFRVTSKIDSRTILDTGGADQLIGRGDMLLSTGNDLIRIQCAFVDTPEVDKITEFIGNQRGYPDALILPEVPTEDGGEAETWTMANATACSRRPPAWWCKRSKAALRSSNAS
jgi:S-DNA-T family DNA segregation ATPase FtsK/SpoIIIE